MQWNDDSCTGLFTGKTFCIPVSGSRLIISTCKSKMLEYLFNINLWEKEGTVKPVSFPNLEIVKLLHNVWGLSF